MDAERRRNPVRHNATHERFIDDHRSGSGTEVAAMETASGDDRAAEGLEEPRADRRCRDADLERRSGAGRDFDGRGPPDLKRCSRHAIGERDGDHIGFLRDLLLEPRVCLGAPIRHLLAGGPIELDAGAEVLMTRKLRVNADEPDRLAGALDAARDGDGRKRHLRDHGRRPEAAEPERAAARTQIHQMRLQARSRDSQRRQERHHGGACDREAAGVEHCRDVKAGRHPERNASPTVQHRFDSPAQRAIGLINTGILRADAAALRSWLSRLGTSNAQGEYYLTDIFAMAAQAGQAAAVVRVADPIETEGANDAWQLATLERAFQLRAARALATAGVRFADPARFDQRGNVGVGQDVEIDVDVVLEGEVELGEGVRIGPFCRIRNARIGAGTVVQAHSDIDGALIGERCVFGPYARLRPGTELGEGAHVGNFVETKKARIGRGSKANHLSYLGDAEIGDGVNIGAGTITCNYDGVNKFSTVIGDGAFIGSNSSLVAPVAIGKDATIGAGSVISKDAPEGQLTVARTRQSSIPGWKRPTKKS